MSYGAIQINDLNTSYKINNINIFTIYTRPQNIYSCVINS